jgi:hypothetical protein
MNTLICDAIRERRLLRFIYEGYERVVEPHLYGINTANHEMLSGWLVAGWSASKPEPGWRNYLVQEMHDIHVLATPFEPAREGYNPDDRGLRQVYCGIGLPEAERRADDLPDGVRVIGGDRERGGDRARDDERERGREHGGAGAEGTA